MPRKNGAFDAVSQGYLASMQLSIILDRNDPSNVVESYGFYFSYSEVTNSQSAGLNTIIMANHDGKSITVRSARYGLNMIIKYLIQLSQTLPDLPGRNQSLRIRNTILTNAKRRGT